MFEAIPHTTISEVESITLYSYSLRTTISEVRTISSCSDLHCTTIPEVDSIPSHFELLCSTISEVKIISLHFYLHLYSNFEDIPLIALPSLIMCPLSSLFWIQGDRTAISRVDSVEMLLSALLPFLNLRSFPCTSIHFAPPFLKLESFPCVSICISISSLRSSLQTAHSKAKIISSCSYSLRTAISKSFPNIPLIALPFLKSRLPPALLFSFLSQLICSHYHFQSWYHILMLLSVFASPLYPHFYPKLKSSSDNKFLESRLFP